MADVHGLYVLCDVDLLAGVAAHAALPLTAGYPDHQPLDLRLELHLLIVILYAADGAEV